MATGWLGWGSEMEVEAGARPLLRERAATQHGLGSSGPFPAAIRENWVAMEPRGRGGLTLPALARAAGSSVPSFTQTRTPGLRCRQLLRSPMARGGAWEERPVPMTGGLSRTDGGTGPGVTGSLVAGFPSPLGTA